MKSESKINVIINADDYGMRECVSEAILACLDMGIVTQTTAMVNRPSFDSAVKMAERAGVMERVGLHLNLTYGMPLTDSLKACPRFCDSRGRFNGSFHCSVKGRLRLRTDECFAVAQEIEAQMKRYVQSGFRLMHLDSHHHVHTDFAVARIVIPLAMKYGFKSIRISRNSGRMGLLKGLYKFALNKYLGRDFTHADYFGDANSFSLKWKDLSQASTYEIMTHPVYRRSFEPDDFTVAGSIYDGYEDISRLQDLVRQCHGDVNLITYSELS